MPCFRRPSHIYSNITTGPSAQFCITSFTLGYSSIVKSLVYKSSIRPVLEYVAQVWNPLKTKDINVIKSVQQRMGCCFNKIITYRDKFDKFPRLAIVKRKHILQMTLVQDYDVLHKRYSFLCFQYIYNYNFLLYKTTFPFCNSTTGHILVLFCKHSNAWLSENLPLYFVLYRASIIYILLKYGIILSDR